MSNALRNTLKIAFIAGLGVAISGCARTSKALGLTKSTPNEFNILTKAPLVIPPEYNLRPPKVGESSAENNYTQQAARDALVGNIDAAEPSQGEIILMTKAGVPQANQDIRLELDGINGIERKTSGFTDQVLFWRDGRTAIPNGEPIDPQIEERRLRSIESATGGGNVTITKRPPRAKLPGL